MTISGVLGATTSGSTGSVYEQVWDYTEGLNYVNDCKSNFNFFIKDRMPSWIINKHPKFVTFIELFFDWLGCENDMAIIESIKDVDVTPDDFVKLFKDVFAKGFPDKTFKHEIVKTPLSATSPIGEISEVLVDFLNPSLGKVDVRNFLRHIKTLYQMKSIEEVYDYFFRVFYDSWVSISYPKTLVIRCSEAPFRGASAGTTGAPCDYWGQTYGVGVPTGDCWCWEDSGTMTPCWNPGGRTSGTPYCDCPQGCAPGHPCGVYYDDEYGTLSGLSKIQDSKIWQDYSYLIDSNLSWDVYWPYVKKLIHPSGLYAAGNYTIWDDFDQPGVTGDIFEIENPITGFYAPYRFETDINLRLNPSKVDLYPCGWLPYLGGTAHGGGPGDAYAGATYSTDHIQDSGGLWYKNESGATAHEPRLAGVAHGTHGFTAAPLGLTGHTGGTAATNISINLFHIYHHPNSWTNEISAGTKMKDVELGQFIFISPIDIVAGTPNTPAGSTADCGF